MLDRLSKWNFLILGVLLVAASVFLWYWDWRWLGQPSPLRPEHMITILLFLVGLVILGIFLCRLTRRQAMIAFIILIGINSLAALVTYWIQITYPAFFDLLRPLPIEEYKPEYVINWELFFLNPLLFFMHSGLLTLWLISLTMFLFRKKGEEPG
ncbi:MAG: hypothetical protein ABIG43_01900 [Chloroflexota bacterium]